MVNLDVFWGGFLHNSCMPLELSLNWCSHNCAYCFANLNDPNREANIKEITALLIGYKNRDSYAAYLLQQGYGVTFSNHVDPFATTNDKFSLNLIELMLLKDIPFSLQTKGGRRVYEALDLIDRPIVWYVSIATLNEDIARSVEPGAPAIAERLRMIEKIIEGGHQVCVGINPTVPDWLPKPKELTDILKSIGVWGAWVQPLHLNSKQMQNMPQRGQKAMGNSVIHQGLRPRQHPEVHLHYLAVREAALASGLQVYDNQQKEPSDYFEPYRRTYAKRFPLFQDFVNHCHKTKNEGEEIYWEEFRDFFLPQLPDCGSRGLRDHINATSVGQNLYGKYIYQRMTYEELLMQSWKHKDIAFCPVNTDCFAWIADWEKQENGEEGWTLLVDDNDLPILTFQPEGTNGEGYIQW